MAGCSWADREIDPVAPIIRFGDTRRRLEGSNPVEFTAAHLFFDYRCFIVVVVSYGQIPTVGDTVGKTSRREACNTVTFIGDYHLLRSAEQNVILRRTASG